MVAFLYDLIYLIPFLLIAQNVLETLQIFAGISMKEHSIAGVGMLFLTGILCLILRHGKNKMRYSIPLGVALLGVISVLLQEKEERLTFITEHQWVIWMMLTAVVCYAVVCLLSFGIWARRGFILFSVIVLGMQMFRGVETDKLMVTSIFFLILIMIAEEIQSYWTKSGYTDRQSHMVYIVPFILILCVIVQIIPFSDRPYDWNFAVRIWEKTGEQIKISSRFFHRNDEDYAKVYTGFSQEGTFKGSLFSKSKDIMQISGKKELGTVIYLKGVVYDSFDGREWTSGAIPDERNSMDFLETAQAVRCYEPDYVRNYIWNVSMNVKYDSYNTKYLFLPAKSVLRGNKIGEIDTEWVDGSILSTQQLGFGTEYTIPYYRLNREHKTFRDFLGQEHVVTEQGWNETLQIYNLENELNCSFEAYQQYHDAVYATYLSKAQVSDRVKEYLEKLLEGAESDADKLYRIESMLGKMRYSTKPGVLPETVADENTFLDYFLFEGQEGYCSYFATAFVLMARAEGIPARYVQGYYVNRGTQNEIVITSDMAHAWPEAYIDGVGWISFEPTPGYRLASSWAVMKKAEGEYESIQDMLKEQQNLEEEMIYLPEQKEKDLPVRMKAFKKILLIAGSLVLFLFLFLVINYLVVSRRYRSMNTDSKLVLLYQKNLFLLNVLGYSISEGMTIEEYRESLFFEFPAELLVFLEDYERKLYSGNPVSSNMCISAEHANSQLLELVKQRKGRWFYLYCRGRNLY